MFGLSPGDRALVVAVHPDDESFGPGGTIAALADAGVTVDVLAITCTSLPMYGGTSDARVRAAEFTDACDALGVRGRAIAWTDTDHARNPGAFLPDLITLIESGAGPSLRTSAPDALLLPAHGAHHQDHQAVHRAALAAARPGDRRLRPVPRIVLGYDGPEDRAWQAADHRPLLVDTTAAWAVKEKALRCHASQVRDAPHPRSVAKIRALDEAAGAACGVGTAERFAIYRMEV
ncbi:PIG-L family deacetylase [Planomonospora sp. ID91781]|uniref:PIG-L deacetylase family protein n=1 Tax=Planomonospora sp. ID91781 TaxID=2738135 RepID=UPI0018C40223|nr:PIG-L deacetylase family protein [Planomonospora sp. ID91781]MBG0825709.1 PIG-L family deacetylase [Planomonospora sp. ID91781]